MGRGGGRVPGRLWPLESSERRGVRLELGPNCTMCMHSRRTSSCAEMGSVSIHCRLVLRELVCVLAGDDRAEKQQQRVGRVERGGGFMGRHCRDTCRHCVHHRCRTQTHRDLDHEEPVLARRIGLPCGDSRVVCVQSLQKEEPEYQRETNHAVELRGMGE